MDVTLSPGVTPIAEITPVQIRILPDGRMTSANAALYLGVEPQTLTTWRHLGKGPSAYTKIGGRVFYRQAVLDSFIESGLQEIAVA